MRQLTPQPKRPAPPATHLLTQQRCRSCSALSRPPELRPSMHREFSPFAKRIGARAREPCCPLKCRPAA
eukprot:4799065-Pyramimonas_sp.AAC.1